MFVCEAWFVVLIPEGMFESYSRGRSKSKATNVAKYLSLTINFISVRHRISGNNYGFVFLNASLMLGNDADQSKLRAGRN